MIADQALTIERFTYEELSLAVVRHKKTPLHRVLTRTQRQELIQLGRIQLADLPKLRKTDPVAKWYGAKSGDVVEYWLTGQLAGELYPYWRVVV